MNIDPDTFLAELTRKGISFTVNGIPASAVTAKSAPQLATPQPIDDVVESTHHGLTWTLPIKTASEANGRDWRKRSARTVEARVIVCEAFARSMDSLAPVARHLHAGGRVRVRYTRLGGRGLDPMVNLPSSLKAVEDAVCLYLGIVDRGDHYEAICSQEPGGPWGVKVELETIGGRSITQ